jgi:putative MATE family efflux protein
MEKQTNSSRLGNEPIKKLLLRLSIPSTIALILGNSYNLVDTIFVGRLGVEAISAISIVFPIQMVLAGIATGVGVGSQSLISRLLGKKQKEDASFAAGNSILLAIIFGFITLILGIFFTRNIVSLFISDPTLIDLATSYARIILLGSFTLFYLRAGLNILRGQGNYNLPMFILLFTAIFNIILDPILIFGLLGFPELGIEGAAIATVLSRLISCIPITIILFSQRNEVPIRISSFKINPAILRSIVEVGIPTIMIQLVMSITIAGTNKILEGLSIAALAIAVVGIYFKLQSIILTPVLALNRCFVPIVGYNFGAKNFNRIIEALKIALIFSFVVSFFAFLAFELIPGQLISLFNSNEELIQIGTSAFQRMNLLFFIVGPAVIFISLFQGMGKAVKVFFALAVRQFIAFFPLLYLLTISKTPIFLRSG